MDKSGFQKIFEKKLDFLISLSRGRCGLPKTEKIFSANHKTGRKVVSRKTLKKIDLENFRSESFSIHTSEGRAPASELVLQRGSLPSEIATAGLFD